MIGGRSGIIWVLIFMIPVVFASKIHDSYKNFLLDSWFTKTFHHLYWLNDFLSGNLVSFCSVSLVFKLLFHPDSVSSFVLSRYGVFFCNCTKHQITVETSRLSARNAWVIQGVRGHPHPKIFLKIGPSETPYPAFTTSNAVTVIHTCILLSFSQSPVTHYPRAEVQRFIIPKFFKTKIHDSYLFCCYDSWFRFHPRSYYKVDEYLPLKSEKIYVPTTLSIVQL